MDAGRHIDLFDACCGRPYLVMQVSVHCPMTPPATECVETRVALKDARTVFPMQPGDRIMSVNVFAAQEVQDLLNAAANLNSDNGDTRAKQITHRLLSDLFKAIDDLNITPDEIWAGVNYFNKLGGDGEAALLAAGLGLEKYLDI